MAQDDVDGCLIVVRDETARSFINNVNGLLLNCHKEIRPSVTICQSHFNFLALIEKWYLVVLNDFSPFQFDQCQLKKFSVVLETNYSMWLTIDGCQSEAMNGK